jgi:hypothetical protein
MINTWNESLLHEELKDYYAGNTGKTEVSVEGSICDVVLDDGSIVEVQTANLGKLKSKLEKLLVNHQVNLVYPIARNTTIETYEIDGSLKSRRKSPKHGTIFQIFRELTGIWHLVGNPNLTFSVVFSDILELRVADGTGSWRRKGVRKDDRKLTKMYETMRLCTLDDFAHLVPDKLEEPFSVQDLRKAGAGLFAGKMAWILKKCGILAVTGKKGNALLYCRTYIKRGTDTETVVPSPSVEVTETFP